MFCIDIDLLDYKIKKACVTREAIANACKCSRTTLWRHLRDCTVTIKEIHSIIIFLNLNEKDVKEIFFADKGA